MPDKMILCLLGVNHLEFDKMQLGVFWSYVDESDCYSRPEMVGKCSGQKIMICLNLICISEHIKINAILHPSLISLPCHSLMHLV